jgi:hypothetical protein
MVHVKNHIVGFSLATATFMPIPEEDKLPHVVEAELVTVLIVSPLWNGHSLLLCFQLLHIKLTDFNRDMLYGKNVADSIYPIVMRLPFLSDGRGHPLACFLPIKKPGLAVASLAISS